MCHIYQGTIEDVLVTEVATDDPEVVALNLGEDPTKKAEIWPLS